MKKLTQLMIKKILALFVTICFVLSITNLPVYAGTNTILTSKTTDAVLAQSYTTPLQASKQTTKKTVSTKNTTKPKATTSSLTTKIIKEYTKTGLTVLKKLASKLSLTLQTVYDSFVELGVTKEQMGKVGTTLSNLMDKGENFVCCASLAVARYLNININLAALQNLAADISFNFFPSSNGFSGTTGEATVKVIAFHGKKNVDNLTCTYEDLINGLNKGKRVMVGIDCLNRSGDRVSGHVITVIKEQSGYAVYDTLSNGGNKVIYSATEFKKFMNGKKAVGRTDSGAKIVKPVYYTDTSSGVIRYKIINSWGIKVSADTTKFVSYSVRSSYNKSISIIKKFSKNKTISKWLKKEKNSINKIINNGNKTNSQKGQLLEKEFSILNLYKKSINSINSLLKTKGLSKTAKNWLNKAKNLIDKTIGGNKSNSAKETWLNKVVSALKTISNQKVSMLSLAKQTVSGVFSSLKNVLKKNLTYKIYAKYGDAGTNLISEFAKKYNLKQETLYNKFEKEGVSKAQISDVTNILNKIKQAENSLIENKNESLMRTEICKSLEELNSSFKNSKIGNIIKELTGNKVEDVVYNEKIKSNIYYKMYKSYGYEGTDSMVYISKKYNLSLDKVYEQFIKEGIAKEEMTEMADVLKSIASDEKVVNIVKQDSDVNIYKIKKYYQLKENNTLFQNSNIAKVLKQLNVPVEKEFYNEFIENNLNYKIYAHYNDSGISLINGLSGYFDLSQEEIYNQFINDNVSKNEVSIAAQHLVGNMGRIEYYLFGSNIDNSFAEFKRLFNSK